MAKLLFIAFLVVIASVAVFAAPSENDGIMSGVASKIEQMTVSDWNNFKFNNEAIFAKSTGPCGWASSAPACSNACYILGWPYYTYWYASGQCCCS